MSVIPPDRLDQIEFCERHVPVWSDVEGGPGAIGLSEEWVDELAHLAVEARAAFDEAQTARQASRAATAAFHGKTARMRERAADMVRAVKAFAEFQEVPAQVLAAAQVPGPAAPVGRPAPGRPTDIDVELEGTGAVTISWSASDAAACDGAVYLVSRRLPGETGYTLIDAAPGLTAASGRRRMRFTDSTIPASAAGEGVSYIIRGRRGERLGEACEPVAVQFGVGAAALRMAA
jgi:hypothetical protein